MAVRDDQTLRSMMRDDAYHVERVLAEGPSGRTELVTLDGEGPLVRKRIPINLANAAAWASVMDLNEPLLPQVEDMYRMPDELVVVCTYVPGESLRTLMEREGHLSPAYADRIMADLCHAAGVLHAHGLVHRDITPGNVILAPDGAHLIDLGIARRGESSRNKDTYVLGTWGFAAPEQFGFTQTDARSDVYALGCLLGYMLTGVSPQADGYAQALEDCALAGTPWADVVARSVSFEPSERYQSADALAEALRQVRGGQTAPAPATAEKRAAAQVPSRMPAVGASDGAYVGGVRTDLERLQPRKLTDAPLPSLIAGVFCWVLCGGWTYLMVAMAISYAHGGVEKWGVPHLAMALLSVVGVAVVAYEVYCALTHRRHYAQKQVRPFVVLLRILIIVMITFICMMGGGILLSL